MALLTICDQNRTLSDEREIRDYLMKLGIDYERWPSAERVPEAAPAEDVLAAYAPEIDQLKARGGYVTADVIDVTAETPGIEAMLAKFKTEHWHDEDELSVKLMEILNEDLDSSTTGPFRKEILQSVTRDSKQSTADAKSFDQMPDLTFRMVHCAAGEERDESALFVEAKLVDSDKGCRQYVVEGLHRFVSGRYAPRVTFGMMLGYGATAFHQVDVHLTEYFTNARAKPAKACRSTVLPSGIHASCHTTRHKRRKPCPEDFRALHVWVTRPV